MTLLRGGLIALAVLFHAGTAAGQGSAPLGPQVRLQSSDTRSTLDRETGWVRTVAVLTVINDGDRPVRAPLHVALRPLQAGADTFRVEAALGGREAGPYGTYYFDLSGLIGAGLEPGQQVQWPFSYARPATGGTGYTLEGYGVVNRDPVARVVGPQTLVAGEPAVFDGTESFDPEGDPLEFAWDSGGGAGGADSVVEFSYTLPGTYTLRLRVTDRQGAVDEVFRTVVVVPPGSFALAQVRTLDEAGQPLEGVRVEDMTAPGAGLPSAEDGLFVGAGEPGPRVWRFTLPGRLPVWRQIDFIERGVVLVPSPWLAPEGRLRAPVSPLEAAAIGGVSAGVQIAFAAGSFSQPGELGLTPLDGNTLPLPLPRGWTPLAAFHFSHPGELIEPGAATWLPAVEPRAGDRLAVAAFDADNLEWRVLQVSAGPALAPTNLASGGWLVLALADADPQPPPEARVGEPLPGAPQGEGIRILTAEGSVEPPQRVASLDPERVTARATVTFAGEAGLTSGRFFRAEISERYALADGRVLRTPDYDTTFFAYRDPGTRDPGTLISNFPLRPSLLFAPAELAEARVTAAVLDVDSFAGAVLDPLGGQLAAGPVVVRIPAGAYAQRTVGELREIGTDGFLALLGGLRPAAAFQLNASAALGELEVTIAGAVPGADYVLARLITPAGRPALEPVLRMRGDLSGIARSAEPAAGPRLLGVTGGGRYVLIAVAARPGLLTGVARALDGTAAPGLVAAVVGEPWRALTRAGGAFATVAPPGAWTAEAVDPADANRGTAEFSLASGDAVAQVDIQLVPTGPRVIATVPADGARGVRTVTPVAVTFSEPLDPLSFGPEALVLAGPDGALVPGSLGLNGAATEATFLPVNPLSAAADYRILLDPAIRDRSGLPIEGELEFAFRTAAPPARGIGAELVIFEPGAENVPEEILSRLVGYAPGPGSTHVVAFGGPGTADPEVPVILVNNSTGATATVLSRPDGSFANFIDAGEEDFVEAVFINADGTRVTVPATRQLFDDGRIGLYRYGGILEAQSDGGPVEVFIEPEAIEERVTFELKPLDLNTVLAAFEGSEAVGAQPLGAVRIAHDADKDLAIPADIAFPLDRFRLQLPPGIERAEDATFVLTRAVETVEGFIVYEVLDTMQVDGDRLVTRSPPYPGLLMKSLTTALKTRSPSFKKLGASNLILRAMGLPGIQETVVHQLLLPFMMIVGGTTTDIIGTVKSVKVDAAGNPLGEPQPVLGASVSFNQPPFPPPGKLAPGLFVVSSREPNGFYAIRADMTLEGAGYRLRATHPRFPGQVAAKAGQIGTLAQRFLEFDIRRDDLLFVIPPPSTDDLGEDVSAPRIRASHTPFLPLAGADARLLVVAEDDRELADVGAVLLEARRANGRPFAAGEAGVVFEEVLLATSGRFEHAYRVSAAHAGRVLVEIRAADTSGNLATSVHAVDFGRVPLAPPGGDGGPGPRVTSAWPPPGSVNHAPFPEILLNFSRPLPAAAFAPGAADWITFASPHAAVSVTPSADRREARIRISGATTGMVGLSVGSPLVDEQGRAFDQDPGEEGDQPFNLSFSLAPASPAALGIERGGGVVGAGARLFALERGQTVSPALVAFDVSDPSAPRRIGSLGLPANPADIAYIPAYTLQARLDQPAVKRDLVIAIGGTNGVGEPGTAAGTFKWMWVIDVTDAANPLRLASGNISQDPIALVAKVMADPPLVAYLSLSADVTSLHVVDLPAFVIGHNATPEQRAAFPEAHTPGLDLNGDGDFADPGERVSLPARAPATYFGEFFSFAPLNPRERLSDFTTGPNGGLFAITYNPDTRATRFLNILATIGELDDNPGSLTLPDMDGKRVATLGAVPLTLDGQARLLDLALVSVRGGEAMGPALAVIDISNALQPRLLGFSRLPADTGTPQSILRRADGTLALAMTSDLLILDPSLLLETGPSGESLAVLQRIPGLGSGARSYVAGAEGLNALALGSRAAVTFTGPQFSFLTFNRPPAASAELAALGEDDKLQLLGEALPSAVLRRAAITFTEGTAPPGGAPPPVPSAPSPFDHHYVLVRAPGGAGATLPLLLASVDPTGRLPAPGDGSVLPALLGAAAGPAGDPPVFPVSLPAHRLSGDPGSPLYNTYLAGPFTLHAALSADQARALTAQLPRAFLKANRRVVVGLPPAGGAASFLDPFRSQAGPAGLVPGTSVVAPTDYRRNPLVFVPGVMASELNDGSFFDLWVPVANTFVQRLPFFAPMERLATPANGEVFPTKVLDEIRLIASLDIQGEFIAYLRDELGYGEYTWDYKGVNERALRLESDGGRPNWESLAGMPELFPFPYDWRRDNAETARRLADYVRLILSVHSDADQVDIVAHSMGGLVARRFQLEEPGRVGNFISICSPFLGATKAIGTMRTGDLGEFALNLLVPADISVRIARNMPALHQLMPNEGLFRLGFRPLVEAGWDINNNRRRYDRLGYADYVAALDGPIYRDFRPEYRPAEPRPISRHNAPFHTQPQYDWSREDSGTRFYHIVSVQQMPRTIGVLELAPELVPTDPMPDIGLSFPPVRFFDSEQPARSGPLFDPDSDLDLLPESFRLSHTLRPRRVAGDGTVPLLSQTRGYRAGNGHDLNAPGTVMAAIVSRSPSERDDRAASHLDVLRNAKLQQLIGRILTRGLERDELPQLTITASDAVQGQRTDFSVAIAGPVPVDESPVVVWDTGDGRTLNTMAGSHVYGDSGLFTLTCAVYYPEAGIGTVASKAIAVRNAPPVVTLVAEPAVARPGESVTLRVDRSDTAFGDEHTYVWSFDGVEDPSVPSSAFMVRRAYRTEGTHSAQVVVTDNDGVSATANVTFTIGATLPQPADPPRLQPASSLLVDPPSRGAPLEYAEITITGHDASAFGTIAIQDGSLLTNTLLGIAMDYRSVVQELGGERVETVTIFRAPNANGVLPQECQLRLTAVSPRVFINLRHVRTDNNTESYFWAVAASPGQTIALVFRWDDLSGLQTDALRALTSPTAFQARRVSGRPGDAPAVSLQANQVSGRADLVSFDRIDEAATLIDGEPVSLVETVPDDDPTTPFDESTTLEGAPVYRLSTRDQPLDALPTDIAAIVAPDSQAETTVDQEPAKISQTSPPITPQQADAIKAAIRKAFIDGLELIKPWLISTDHIWVLEQGTGASLWKDQLEKSAYVPGISDNDFELLMPVFVTAPGIPPGDPIDLFDAGQAEAFHRVAHIPTYMTGDWYFKPPVGVDGSGREMGEIPDLDDEDEYAEYVFVAQKWRYYLPRNITATLGGPAQGSGARRYLEVEKGVRIGGIPLFDHPATPAQVIAAFLTENVRTDPELRRRLKDVTFFPYRREHFVFGVPSLERPPPFGDDPIGDAGMGRGLLMLKWVLEGVFIPPGDGFPFNQNLPRPDAELRSLVHSRLAARSHAIAMESFEWGVLQEYALLAESAHLRMYPGRQAELAPSRIFSDYLTTHEEMIMRKVGKAVIRGLLARMVADNQARAAIFATTPAEFENEDAYRTFEDFIAAVAQENTTLVGLSEQEIREFLGAKLADDATFRRIRARTGGVDALIRKGFSFLRDSVQIPSLAVYEDLLDGLPEAGRPNEYRLRSDNAIALDRGIRSPDGTVRPGRAALHGLESGAEARYSFFITLHKRGFGDAASLPFDLVLENEQGGDVLVWPDLVIPAGRHTLKLSKRNPTDEEPFFTVRRPISATLGEQHIHNFFLAGAGMDGDSFAANNTATFNSRFLQLDHTFLERFERSPLERRTRWVFRGIRVTEETMRFIENDELAQGLLKSAAIRNGVDYTTRRDEMAADLERIMEGGGNINDEFFEEDLPLWNADQKAALAHVNGVPENSVGISTAEKIFFPLTSGLTTNLDPGEKAFLFALEVTVDQGIEYLPRSNGAPRRINADEGNEVVYMGILLFERAYVFEVDLNNTTGLKAANRLNLRSSWRRSP